MSRSIYAEPSPHPPGIPLEHLNSLKTAIALALLGAAAVLLYKLITGIDALWSDPASHAIIGYFASLSPADNTVHSPNGNIVLSKSIVVFLGGALSVFILGVLAGVINSLVRGAIALLGADLEGRFQQLLQAINAQRTK